MLQNATYQGTVTEFLGRKSGACSRCGKPPEAHHLSADSFVVTGDARDNLMCAPPADDQGTCCKGNPSPSTPFTHMPRVRTTLWWCCRVFPRGKTLPRKGKVYDYIGSTPKLEDLQDPPPPPEPLPLRTVRGQGVQD